MNSPLPWGLGQDPKSSPYIPEPCSFFHPSIHPSNHHHPSPITHPPSSVCPSVCPSVHALSSTHHPFIFSKSPVPANVPGAVLALEVTKVSRTESYCHGASGTKKAERACGTGVARHQRAQLGLCPLRLHSRALSPASQQLRVQSGAGPLPPPKPGNLRKEDLLPQAMVISCLAPAGLHRTSPEATAAPECSAFFSFQ